MRPRLDPFAILGMLPAQFAPRMVISDRRRRAVSTIWYLRSAIDAFCCFVFHCRLLAGKLESAHHAERAFPNRMRAEPAYPYILRRPELVDIAVS